MDASEATYGAFEYFPSLKNVLWVLGTFVAWFGFVATSTYYAQFGITYYSLNIPLQHMFNRGLTIMLASSAFGLLFAFVFAILSISEANVRFRLFNIIVSPSIYGPTLLTVVFIIGWYSAYILARDAAYRDMYSKSSNLSSLVSFQSTNKEKESYVETLITDGKSVMLLYADKDVIVFFREPALQAEVPKIPVHTITLEKHDVYARRAPS